MIQISVFLGCGFCCLVCFFFFFNTYTRTFSRTCTLVCLIGESKKSEIRGTRPAFKWSKRSYWDSGEKGKLRATSQPTVPPTSWANQVKKIADDFKCLTQHAFKIPRMQIQAWSLLSTTKDPEALFNPCTMSLVIAGMLSTVKSEALYFISTAILRKKHGPWAPWHPHSLKGV